MSCSALGHGSLSETFLEINGRFPDKRRTDWLRLQLHLGSHSQWNESNLSEENAPQPQRVLDEHRGVVTHGQVVEFDVSSAIVKPGPITLILTLNKSHENDIWFGSREGSNPPQLVLSAIADVP